MKRHDLRVWDDVDNQRSQKLANGIIAVLAERGEDVSDAEVVGAINDVTKGLRFFLMA